MRYIHTINKEFKEDLKMMFDSSDYDTMSFALAIINNSDMSDEDTKNNILTLTKECCLVISRTWEAGTFLSIIEPSEIDFTKQSEKEYYFYSPKILQLFYQMEY